MNNPEITRTSISVETHQKAKIVASIIGKNLTEFYNTAIIQYIENIAKDNEKVKKYFEIK